MNPTPKQLVIHSLHKTAVSTWREAARTADLAAAQWPSMDSAEAMRRLAAVYRRIADVLEDEGP